MKKVEFDDKIYISGEIQNYYIRTGTKITIDLIVSSIADKLAGYHLSYSANELLKDIKVLTKKDKINKKGLLILSHHLHYTYHLSTRPVFIVQAGGQVI
jgi:hypothetical protein